jgi:opacity protein-like surface antigen
MRALLSIVFALSLIGCATIPQGTTPAASPLISAEGKAKSYEVIGKGEGSAGHFSLFGFIPFGRANIDAAIQDAVAQHQGDNLINVHYYVNSAFYLIGSSTSITVKGDVIKYSGVGVPAQPSSSISRTLPMGRGGLSHRLAIGSAIDGFGIDYSLNKSLSDYLLLSFTLGYKRYEKTETETYTYFGYYVFSYSYKTKYDVLPIALNIGSSAKKALTLPLNAYVSAGVAYMPLYSSYSERFKWNQVGFNVNVGADYELAKGFALGVDYRYFKSLTDLESSSGASGSNIPGVKFSNLSLSVVFYP